MRRRIGGWALTVTGVISCPCHLVITLPLAVALLGGTALGGWMATHEGAIAVGAGVYFVSALTLGLVLLSAQRSQASHPSHVRVGQPEREGTCCPPGHSLRADPNNARSAGQVASSPASGRRENASANATSETESETGVA